MKPKAMLIGASKAKIPSVFAPWHLCFQRGVKGSACLVLLPIVGVLLITSEMALKLAAVLVVVEISKALIILAFHETTSSWRRQHQLKWNQLGVGSSVFYLFAAALGISLLMGAASHPPVEFREVAANACKATIPLWLWASSESFRSGEVWATLKALEQKGMHD